ncbi:helix-turn-helix transcriptional regulator [Altererythrobacter sp.]|uniref:helix-turn-helix transcriptional regulator n=1 Tax=Altererythrobacter sp. TaxID=1872480 RepID=UPI003CFF1B00
MKNQLRQFRVECGLTQEELAQMVGVTRKTINTVENSVFIPSTVLALKLAKALETDVHSLFQLPESLDSDPC